MPHTMFNNLDDLKNLNNLDDLNNLNNLNDLNNLNNLNNLNLNLPSFFPLYKRNFLQFRL